MTGQFPEHVRKPVAERERRFDQPHDVKPLCNWQLALPRGDNRAARRVAHPDLEATFFYPALHQTAAGKHVDREGGDAGIAFGRGAGRVCTRSAGTARREERGERGAGGGAGGEGRAGAGAGGGGGGRGDGRRNGPPPLHGSSAAGRKPKKTPEG